MSTSRVHWTRDEIILACDLVWENGWKALDAANPAVLELSELLIGSPLHPKEIRPQNFRNPNGVGRKTSDIATRHPDYAGRPTRGNKLDEKVLHDFIANPEEMHRLAAHLRALLHGEGFTPGELRRADEDSDGGEFETSEGRLIRAWQLKRERDPKLRQKKIAVTKAAGIPLICEVCSFDFLIKYGEMGRDYIEVHHVIPLHASGETRTRLRDLVLLCSNCHRMIHRRRAWVTPEALRAQMTCAQPALPGHLHGALA